MKNIKKLGLLILAVIGLFACEQDDDFMFTAQEPSSEISFTNTFLESYVLTTATSSNLGERFTWNSADYGVPTVVTYKLEKSISGDFTDAETIGETTANEMAVTIGQLLTYAAEVGLDNDPNTANPDTGLVYFRLNASVGTDALQVISPIQSLNLFLPAQSTGGGLAISSWGIVGSGYNNWGAFADAKFYTTATAGVIVSYVNLIDGEIKFRENNNWGGDLGDANLDGVLDSDADNNIAVTSGNYKITINTNNMSYTIVPFSWGIVGSGYNDWGATPDAKLYYDYTTDTFKVGVQLIDGEIKFRMNNTWGGDLGDANLDGVLDADADNNIAVTAGHYLVTLDLKDNSYSIEPATVWGVVGSGYNNWGATPDASLTEIQPGVWFAENITLVDGEIKFRKNDAWGGDLGDATLDNILDADADNNIAVTAGKYVISIDFNDAAGPKYTLGKRN